MALPAFTVMGSDDGTRFSCWLVDSMTAAMLVLLMHYDRRTILREVRGSVGVLDRLSIILLFKEVIAVFFMF